MAPAVGSQNKQYVKTRTHTLVVGGTRGIGRALVKVLIAERGNVSVFARHPPKKKVSRARYWTVDVTDCQQISDSLSDVVRQRGKLDGLVFLQRYRGEGDSWQAEFETSLTGTKTIIEGLVPHFRKTGGAIVVVSSVNSEWISRNLSVGYHVAKAGLNSMVRYYAVTLGSKNIRVNSVSPGTVLKEETQHFYLKDRAKYDLHASVVPLERMGHADEVAQVVVFLCSPKSSFVTGQDIVVDGGVSLQWHEVLAGRLKSKSRRIAR